MSNGDVVQGNRRFKALNKERLVVQLWDQVEVLGVNGGNEVESHIKLSDYLKQWTKT